MGELGEHKSFRIFRNCDIKFAHGGVPLWHSGLKIQRCHGCGWGLIPGLGASTKKKIARGKSNLQQLYFKEEGKENEFQGGFTDSFNKIYNFKFLCCMMGVQLYYFQIVFISEIIGSKL